MGNNDLAIRFTETIYATKNNVSTELRMSLIDNIWNNILSYRSNFYHYLTIKSIDKNSFFICNCPTISSKINSLDAKLIRLMAEYLHISINEDEKKYFSSYCLNKIVNSIGKKYELSISQEFIDLLLNGKYFDIDVNKVVLKNYLSALNIVKNQYVTQINIDYLANLFSKISGNENLTEFYRNSDDDNPLNKVLIDRIYTCAPSNQIEEMMNSLFVFISNSSLSAISKAIITFYYVSYIKPFKKYNDEIAILLFKSVLAHNGLSEFASYFPIESFLVESDEKIAKIYSEVQKSNDITYFINFAFDFINNKADEMLNELTNHHTSVIKSDMYKEDSTAVVEKVANVNNNETKEKVDKTETNIEKSSDKIDEQISTETLKHEKEKISVSYIPPALDERTACRLEEHLLEIEPTMKKGEAHFFARHCSIGKSYTIAQYKRCIGCVYETARTSMEHLVKLGYYQKELINNKKFVYTPIAKN